MTNLLWKINEPPQFSLVVPSFQLASSNVSHLDHAAYFSTTGDHYTHTFYLFLEHLLWHPGKALFEIAATACSFMLTAPPLIRCGLLYLILRYVIFRSIVLVVDDYQAYLDLGRGGSPCDPWGWWRVTRLKMMAGLNVLDAPHVPPMLDPYRGILWHLPQRTGPRPVVRGIAPQRQINQRTPISTFDALLSMIMSFSDTNHDDLRVETSFLEGHTAALKLNCHDPIGIPNTRGEFGFEICHPHRTDGSIHMIMHPEDIRTVIDAGWGERHPLATSRWYWRLWYHDIRQKRTPVSEYLVLVYAPRNQAELEVVYRLMQASVWFATRKVLEGKVPQLNTYISDYIPERQGFLSTPGSKCTCYDG